MSGFVFKVQANMDPNHRDRVAFLRLCSGKFRRGMKLTQMGTGKILSVNSPILFFAREREIVDEAWPGDIIGIPNHGVLRVGDTLTEGEVIKIVGIPNFAPEILRRVRLEDPMKSKQLKRALDDLAEEGVTQVFRRVIGGDNIVGVVGELQLDVLKTRVEAEYNVNIDLEPAPFDTARWISAETKADLEAYMSANRGGMSEDRDGSPVVPGAQCLGTGLHRREEPERSNSPTSENGLPRDRGSARGLRGRCGHDPPLLRHNHQSC